MTRDFGVFLTNSALKRRDIFPSREDALAWLKSRAGFKVWDERVLQAFVVRSCIHRLKPQVRIHGFHVL